MRRISFQFQRLLVLLSLSASLCTTANADILDRLVWGAVGSIAISAINEGVKNGCHPVEDRETRQVSLVCNKKSSASTQNKYKEPPVVGASPGRETKGQSSLWEKDGGMDAADEDFDSLQPVDIQDLPKGGRRGTLPDGRKIVVRPNSDDGRPTLEIQNGRKREKVRYNQ